MILRNVFLALIVIFLLMQFIRTSKNNSSLNTPTDITRVYPVPPDVVRLLRAACYDCHSDSSKYPVYFNIQPVGWWMTYHINNGKRHLNFSRFGNYTHTMAMHKFKQISRVVTKHQMPIASYLWEHPEGRLTPMQIARIASWADSLQTKP
ncbi:MAG TPA: heme-binding domain-containing protein [Chitinophagaceae bacterium]|nr:heme-binding domain-containing protein [Chitinophagaceae bacterium]